MPRKSTQAIVIHCTATLAHQDFRRDDIDAMHRRRGFRNGIGYHYLIDLSGKIEVGRAPDDSVGAHVQGFNDRTLGIAYVGGLRSSDAKPVDTRTDAQKLAMETLCRKLLVKYPSAVILGHRDLSPDLDGDGVVEPHEWMKQCPCFDAANWAKAAGLPGGRYSKGMFRRLI
jgi:N-acetyl-anhydromuramyl-L-alanine amidase AmpD